jgi:hypothetical protein
MDKAQILAFIASSNHALSLDRFMALRMSRRVLSTCRTAAVRALSIVRAAHMGDDQTAIHAGKSAL